MMPELALPERITTETEDAAAATMRRVGARVQATADDIDLVLAVLFSEVLS